MVIEIPIYVSTFGIVKNSKLDWNQKKKHMKQNFVNLEISQII